MPVNIVTAHSFLIAAKKLLKKYKSLKAELAVLETQLLNKPDLGTPLGQNAYKIQTRYSQQEVRQKWRGACYYVS